MSDLLIKNVRLIENNSYSNVYINNGIIQDISTNKYDAEVVIDGNYSWIVPGLIDFHTHIFHVKTGLGACVFDTPFTGLTGVVDAGSSGVDDFEFFYKSTLEPSIVEAKAFISCFSKGMTGPHNHENFDYTLFEPDKIAMALEKYPNSILGLKIRVGAELMTDLTPLRKAVEMSDKYLSGVPICVHITNCAEPIHNLIDILRKGDIICHVYHGTGNTVLDSNGRVLPEVVAGREKGIIFDSSNGNANNVHYVTLKCLEQGFLPDIISTDLTIDKLCKGQRARSLPFIMSKYLSMGMELKKIIKCTSSYPASIMGVNRAIDIGEPANLTILKQDYMDIVYEDSIGEKFQGNKVLIPLYSVIGENTFKARNDCVG